MRILLVNDDGIDAPGIRALVEQLKDKNEVYVCAPASQRSGYSHGVTYFHGATHVQPRNIPGAVKAWAVDGTPADCSYLGIYELMDEKPDLLISGINQGQNMSADIVYSGTIGAACEGLIGHVPSIAVSWCSFTDTDFTTAAKVTQKAVDFFMNQSVHDYVLSVNVPALPYEEIKGVKWAWPQPCRDFERPLARNYREDGSFDIITTEPISSDVILSLEGTDLYEVSCGYVTLTPIGLDPSIRSVLFLQKNSEKSFEL